MTVPTTILVVDDDSEVRSVLRRCFELDGYHVLEAMNGDQMRQHLAESPIALITLDLKLPGEDGLTLARDVRSQKSIPIIMVTGKDDPIDRVVGLELGADDYITKPFHLREVLARVRAVLRRYEAGTSTSNKIEAPVENDCSFAFGGFVLNTARRELKATDGTVLPLTTAEFNMLKMFVERPTRVLSRDAIMDLLKGHEWSPLDRSIDTLVARLRKKIEADVDNPQFVKTVRGVGYVFAIDVRRV